MRKKLSVVLAGIFSIAILHLNINAFAARWYDICEAENVEANAVIVDIDRIDPEHIDYYYYMRSGSCCTRSVIFAPYLENYDTLVVGDLLKIKNVESTLSDPGELIILDDTTIEYCGNGIKMFGREFEKNLLVRLLGDESFNSSMNSSMLEELGYTVVRGDATEDDEIDMLDVVTVTKAVLGKLSLSDYAECVSDMNENGQVDALDALLIMQYVVGVVDMR
ncbi:MAG: dockerin type I repeat-containing protein [Oscillospiraceae bacterium]|nr:dockerin type I repeat-containing protein [Oscillospiraceae bacterium]